MAELTEAEVTRDLAYEAARPVTLERGRHYAWRGPDGATHEIDLSMDQPSRKTGLVTVRDVASFASYWGKHHDEASEVFADIDAATVAAVLDAHYGASEAANMENGGARWQQHRVTLGLVTTPAWDAWVKYDRVMMPQVDFAEFLEDNYADLSPDGPVKAADFLEAAQSFQAMVKTEFASGQRLSSGDTELTFDESTSASAGRQRKITIPTEFDLAIAPYEDCEASVIAARFRYRVTPQGLRLGYFLNQPERHRRAAVEEITAQVAGAIGVPVLRGIPA